MDQDKEKTPRTVTEIYHSFLKELANPGFSLESWRETLSLREKTLWAGYIGSQNESGKKKIRNEVISTMDPELKEKYIKVAELYGGS
jgi:hypothetical protein